VKDGPERLGMFPAGGKLVGQHRQIVLGLAAAGGDRDLVLVAAAALDLVSQVGEQQLEPDRTGRAGAERSQLQLGLIPNNCPKNLPSSLA
jgi:hypothetical protein